MIDSGPAPVEFSRIVNIEALAAEDLRREIEAGPGERAALAARFGLLALDSLKATVRLKKLRGPQVRVEGEFAADVVQSCVVTLEPVRSRIADAFSITFTPAVELDDGAELDLSPWAQDLPEPLTGGVLDIGEAVAQQLAVALDPYPRAAGVTFAAENYSGLAPERPENGPFAALASLRKNGQDQGR
jgi:uncharacterized metal-binding protein YceD (DUF177 family)